MGDLLCSPKASSGVSTQSSLAWQTCWAASTKLPIPGNEGRRELVKCFKGALVLVLGTGKSQRRFKFLSKASRTAHCQLARSQVRTSASLNGIMKSIIADYTSPFPGPFLWKWQPDSGPHASLLHTSTPRCTPTCFHFILFIHFRAPRLGGRT
jgi:hypothetical protein